MRNDAHLLKRFIPNLYQDDGGGMIAMSGNRGNGRITKVQLGTIKSLRTRAGMSADDVLDLTERMFSTRDPISLNTEMGAAVIAVLENRVNGEKPEDVAGIFEVITCKKRASSVEQLHWDEEGNSTENWKLRQWHILPALDLAWSHFIDK